jgi:hypothetical protein
MSVLVVGTFAWVLKLVKVLTLAETDVDRKVLLVLESLEVKLGRRRVVLTGRAGARTRR